MKRCRYCDRTKPEAEFFKAPKLRDGLSNKCKACCRQYQRDYRKGLKTGSRTVTKRRPPKKISRRERQSIAERMKTDPILQPDGRRRCPTCWQQVDETDPRILRCRRKGCIPFQKARGETRTSPLQPHYYQEMLEAQIEQDKAAGIDQDRYGRDPAYSDFVNTFRQRRPRGPSDD